MACSSARWACTRASSSVERLVLEVGDQQVEHELQRGDRRAQLVRGGSDERAPRLLLLAQPRLHVGERAAEVADLVAAGLGLELGDRADVGDALGGVAQASDPPPVRPAIRIPAATPPAARRSAATTNARRTTPVAACTSSSGRRAAT